MNVYEGKTQDLVYVGKKPVKKDTVAGTGIVWAGYGDVQEVPHSAAVKMLQHPDVWVTEATFKAKYPEKSPHVSKAKPKSKGGTDFSALQQVAPTGDPTGDEEPDEGDGQGDDENGGVTADLAAVKAAILSLDTENKDHFGKQGPKIDAVRAATGDAELGVDLVKAAWKELNANG